MAASIPSELAIALVSDFLRKNGLHEANRTLQTELAARTQKADADCDLLRLAVNHSARTASFDEPRSAGSLSVESRVVSYNASKGDPHGSAAPPLYQTATFAQPSATEFGAFDYTRSGNPTRDAAQAALAELDGAIAAYCFTSGMAAIVAVTRFAHAGQEVILSDDSYGGTYRLLAQVACTMGVTTKFVDLSGPSGPTRLKAAMTPKTALVMCESPTNPMMKVCDLRKLVRVAHSTTPDCLLSVDNTLMTGLLVKPLELGADLCVTSCTKFACGHSDTMAGVVSARDPQVAKKLYMTQNAEGSGLAPFDCWLLLRGLKTMPLRMERAQQNAMAVASFLEGHPRVTAVYYAGLAGHPGRDLHFAQASGAGAVVCFRTGNYDVSTAVASACAKSGLFKITVSFGSVNSLISLPWDMSHASIPSEVKKDREFPTDMIRISVGIESASDLISVLDRSLTAAPPPGPHHAKL